MSQDLINPSWNADAARDMQSLTGFGDKNTAYKFLHMIGVIFTQDRGYQRVEELCDTGEDRPE